MNGQAVAGAGDGAAARSGAGAGAAARSRAGAGSAIGTAEPVLTARDLRVEFRVRHAGDQPGERPGERRRRGARARAVDGVNLDIHPGEIVALVGESGCGKTTLARTLLGLERPAAGEVRYRGQPIRYSARALKAYRRRVQFVQQDPAGSLNPRHTVYEAVAEGLRIHRASAPGGDAGDGPGGSSGDRDGPHDEVARVADALSRAGLRPPERFFLRYPHELSGGQRQRVVIAGALVLGPQVLIADEPVASLDASVRGEILSLLLRLRDDPGLAALVITHDLGLAWNIADRVAVMYLGRIVETGPAEPVLRSPRHPYTHALLSVLPEAGAAAPVILSGEPPDPARIPAGCRFHVRCPLAASGRVDASRCRTEELPVLAGGTAAGVACHFPGVPVRGGAEPERLTPG